VPFIKNVIDNRPFSEESESVIY